MFEDNADNIEDKIDEQQCSGAVVRLGSYFNNITELLQLSAYIRGNVQLHLSQIWVMKHVTLANVS